MNAKYELEADRLRVVNYAVLQNRIHPAVQRLQHGAVGRLRLSISPPFAEVKPRECIGKKVATRNIDRRN